MCGGAWTKPEGGPFGHVLKIKKGSFNSEKIDSPYYA